MIRCRTLGPVTVASESGTVPAQLRWRKHLALVVYLARSPRRARTREHLVGLLWPDKPEKDARHSLREAIRVVRKSVGDDGLVTEGESVRLAAAAVRLDVDDFQDLLEAGDVARAAALVNGEFMEGFSLPDASAFEDWLAAERLAWNRRAVEALGRQAERLLAAGRTEEGVTAAQRALALDPAAEAVCRTAMRGLTLLGRRAAALEALGTLEAALRPAGVRPAKDTAALAARIRAGEAARRPPGGVHRERRPPLLGRERELATLLDLWSDVRGARRAAAAVVIADPGIGKTRLLEECLARARLDGATVAMARAVPADRTDRWSGLLGLAQGGLGEAPGLAGAAGEDLAAIAERVPAWADRFRGTVAGVARELGVAFRGLVAAAAEERDLLLAIDDAQWVDPDSAATLEAALRDQAAAPVLVLIAISAPEPPPGFDTIRARVGRDLPGASLQLGPLSRDALAELTAWVLPDWDEEPRRRLTRRVAADSAGVPLLAVELLHAVASGLELEGESATWPAPFRTLEHTLPADLPDAIVAAIRIGYRRLSPDAQRVLAAASVVPDRATGDVLARATDLPLAGVRAALDELEWNRWLAVEGRGYDFVARIVREVIAQDMLTEGQRRRVRELVNG